MSYVSGTAIDPGSKKPARQSRQSVTLLYSMRRQRASEFRRLIVVLSLCLGGVLFAGRASAQSEEEVAGARAAATEGIKAYNEGRWSAALDLFQRAESLLHAPTHLLFMARANAKLGHLVAARELYNKIVREPLGPKAPKAFQSAQEAAREEITQVEPRIGKLTVTVQAPAGVKPVVKMDGETFPSALVGVPRPVDPGEHVIEASAEGYLVARQNAVVKEGGNASLSLALEPDPNAQARAPAATAPTPAAPPPAPDQDQGVDAEAGTDLAVPAYVALGVGAVGLGVGLVFTLRSAGKRSDADAAFARCQQNGVDGSCKQEDPLTDKIDKLYDDAGSAQTLATVGYVVGGVGIAAGVTLLLLDDSSGTAKREPRVTPFVGYRTVGVVGTF